MIIERSEEKLQIHKEERLKKSDEYDKYKIVMENQICEIH